MLRIALCEDDTLQRERMEHLVRSWLDSRGRPGRIRCYASAEELLEDRLSGSQQDLYLLDVFMTGATGLDAARKLRQMGDQDLIVFLTSSPDFAVESYEVRAFHYLLKPVGEEKLFSVLDAAASALDKRNSVTMQVKTRDAVLRLPVEELMYAELSGRAARYHLTEGRSWETTTLRERFLTAMEPLLEIPGFVACGASFVINLDYVQAVTRSGAVLKDGTALHLPKQSCATLKDAWLRYWLEEDGK